MTVTVHTTDVFVEVQGGVRCRIWEGETASGIKVQVLVPRIAALATENLEQFERELTEMPVPTTMERAFPLRMVL